MSLALQKYTGRNDRETALFVQRVIITVMLVIMTYFFSDIVRKTFQAGPALTQLKNEELARQLNALTYEFRFIVGKIIGHSEILDKDVARLREEAYDLREEIARLRDELGTKVPISHYQEFHKMHQNMDARAAIKIGDMFVEGRYVKRNLKEANNYYGVAEMYRTFNMSKLDSRELEELGEKTKIVRAELAT